jgi:hypothetical protein
MRDFIANTLARSPLNELAVYWLGNVPGLPPIAQSFHIAGIAIMMGTIVLIDLRILGLAVRSQHIGEMIRRLMPWVWGALLVNATSGLLFVVARPYRYFYNPVVAIKFSLLALAVVLALVVHGRALREPDYWERSVGRRAVSQGIALVSLVLWVGVVLAGRWIAYSDYLFFYG